jgi:peptide/nickel transport system permease protein
VIRFLARRFLWALVILWAIGTLTFFGTLMLGDPLNALAGPHASPRDRANIARFYGLDRPPSYQYALYLRHLASGDLGQSTRYHVPVTQMIGERFPRTLLLAVLAMAFEVTVGVALGTLAAWRQGTRADSAIMAGSFVTMSMPTFLSGTLMLMVFAYYTGWFPIGGYGVGFVDHLHHAVLPAVTIGLLSAAYYARLARNDLVEILRADYIRTARAKGLSEREVVLRHALRNALLPVVTSIGLSFGGLFTGAIVTEAIFAWPGLGRLAYEAVTQLDVPVIIGTVLFGAFGILVGNVLSDLAYAALDPRIRRG